MKITTSDGVVFEGTLSEYEEFIAYIERKAEDESVSYEAAPRIEFKKGDQVKIIGLSKFGTNYIGKTGVVEVAAPNLDSYQVKIEGKWCVYSRKNIELVEKEAETIEFEYEPNIGDIVFIVDNMCDAWVSNGDVGKIIENDGSSLPFRIERGDKLKSGWLASKALRPATTEEIAQYETAVANSELKAGDFVKFADNGLDIVAGKPYEIIEDTSGDLIFLDDEGEARSPNREGRTILSAEEAKWAKIGRKVNEWREGDIVRLRKQTTAPFVEGTLGVIAYSEINNYPLVTAVTNSGNVDKFYAYSELIAPVESLFQR